MNEQELKQAELVKLCKTVKGIEVPELVLDGKVPQYIDYPSKDEEVAKILSLAARTKTPLAIVGGGSKFNTGNPLEDLEWVLSTSELTGAPVINTDDLTVFAKAGLTLSELQEHLSQYNLFLPVDSGSTKTTIGGIIAEGGGSSYRLQYGLIRDLLLGLTVALTDGKVYKFGGQTIKNVAGYDVKKLFVGSQGSLGVITEVCLRVYPIPPSSKVLYGVIEEQSTAWKIAKKLEEIQPTVLEIYDLPLFSLYPIDRKKGSLVILVKYLGNHPTIAKQYDETLTVFREYGVTIGEIRDYPGNEKVWNQRSRMIFNSIDIKRNFIEIKISVPRVNAQRMAEVLEALAESFHIEKNALYKPAVGISHVQFNGVNSLIFIKHLEEAIRELGGIMQIVNAELEIRKKLKTETQKYLDMVLMWFFDPEKILNPGKLS